MVVMYCGSHEWLVVAHKRRLPVSRPPPPFFCDFGPHSCGDAALSCKEPRLVAPSYSLPPALAHPNASAIAICLPMRQPEVMIAGITRSNAPPSRHTQKLTAMFTLSSVSLTKGLVPRLSEPKNLQAVIHSPRPPRTRSSADCTHDGLMVGRQK